MSASPPPAPLSPADGLDALRRDGHLLLRAASALPLLSAEGALSDWDRFAASWDGMPVDTYMADGGRYRRRRHAVFALGADGAARPLPPQPHYQSRDYNPLNGGVERWFEQIAPDVADGASLRAVLRFCARRFGALAPSVAQWQVEAHQFRIEALPDQQGQPTPEGVHRDGVDYVLVLLVRRQNIASGVTTIHAPDGASLGSFTLTTPGDLVLIDDARVFHGVTPVAALDPSQPGYRDVLVVTLRRA